MRPVTLPSDRELLSPEVRAFAHEHFVHIFIGANKRSQIGLLLSAGLLAFLWAKSGGVGASLAWLGLVFLYTAMRFAFSAGWVRARSEDQSARRILWMLALSGLLLAIPLWWFNDFSEVQRAAITIIMCSTAAASVSTTAGYRLYFLAYALPMLVPLQIAWIATHSGEGTLSAGLGLAALILVYLAVLVSVAQQSFATFLESCRIRFGEREMNQRLSAALERESEANRAKTQFLAAASHDLRQPIHSLNMLVAALVHRPLDERSRGIVKLMQSVNESLSSELDGLLEISKLDAGVVRPVLSPVSLSELMVGHAATLVSLAQERDVRLDVQVEQGIHVLSDGALLQRIVGNLTSNALKFTPPGGVIRLSVESVGTSAALVVSDNGIGIAPEEHERVFGEFYQVHNTARDRERGLGLGLSIVRRYSDLLAVQVELTSALGSGTTVTLSLPTLAPASLAASGPQGLASWTVPDAFTVLLLDDEAQVREGMRMVLDEWGVRLLTADSITAARELLGQQPVDLVLSDLRLRDGESGLDMQVVLKDLRLDIPMALITGDTAPERIAMAQQASLPLYHKPLSADSLQQVLARAASRRRSPD